MIAHISHLSRVLAMPQLVDLLVHSADASMEGGTPEELGGCQLRGRFSMDGVRTRAVNQTFGGVSLWAKTSTCVSGKE